MSINADEIAAVLRGLSFDGASGAFISYSDKMVAAPELELPEGASEDEMIAKASGLFKNGRPSAINVAGVGSFKIGTAIRVAVVTGGAQGFGAGLVRELARSGYYVFIADMNTGGARKFADELNAEYGRETSAAVEVNVTDEQSVENMVSEVVLRAGGIDLFVNNAGVLKAGSVKEQELSDFEFVTKVNYTGYFLCVKYVSRVMALQNKAAEAAGLVYFTDIIQINSKSGLEGSNKNGAYAGGKFGGIGLTQSFALELVTDHIKVNSICPGNFFEGPLWADPDRGLFVQYLRAGKVPGAKTIEDVKAFYEAKVPMGRGCTPEDIAKALFYLVDQKYETGQALPVTGGQVMLK
ncbi:MAG: SDR family NAD(P)-dependent oxidoreductase [Spirochaetales bacterium]|nr:SDR family NAD(P)-dependent oxidoreductase [Spirochaetales bacterium]